MPALFISDLHLSEERPAANERFFSLLEKRRASADALYILGDFFEYWIGDDDLAYPFNAVIAGALRELSRSGVPLYFMHGNRDFLVGERFCARDRRAAARRPDGGRARRREDAADARRHAVHRRPSTTRHWRRTARSDEWQRGFLAKSLAERRHAVARHAREEQARWSQAKPPEIMDVNDAAVREAMQQPRRATPDPRPHAPPRPSSRRVDGACERWVLPDWYGRGGYLSVGKGAPKLVRF